MNKDASKNNKIQGLNTRILLFTGRDGEHVYSASPYTAYALFTKSRMI